MNIDDLILDSAKSTLKAVSNGSGSIQAPYTASTASNTVTIAHNLATTDVIWAVIGKSASTNYISAPWSSPDGRVGFDAYIDSMNLYITASSSTAGAPQVATDFTYYYTIILP